MIAACILGSVVVMWALYLMYCAINASRKSGKFALTPWPVRAMSYALLLVAATADALFNVTIGTVLFLEWPSWRRIMFTKRCAAHLDADTWRGRIARWVCESWLNPFESDHCR